MHSSTVLTILTTVVATVSAAPAPAWSDPTVCAPGTGYYQVCGNGYKGCCAVDACTIGWCPGYAGGPKPYGQPIDHSTDTKEPQQPEKPAEKPQEGTCPTGLYYQVCGNGYKGCCAVDACTIGWCPGYAGGAKPYGQSNDYPTKTEEPGKPTNNPQEGTCPTGLYYQVCGNGYKGCCAIDACTLGYCPTAAGGPKAGPPTHWDRA